jgi:type IV pilus assembly protein PilA
MACSLLRSSRVRHRRSCQSFVRRQARRAFTLVEMMIVVAIIAILAVLAVVGYKKMITSSNMSEATHMINAIRVAQEAYHAETQSYANPSSAGMGLGNLFPATNPSNFKTGWGGTGALANAWAVLPVHADGAVMYGYATQGGAAGGTIPTLPTGVTGVDFTTLALPGSSTTDFYVIVAIGDPDGNGIYSAAVGDSWTNDIFTFNEGE